MSGPRFHVIVGVPVDTRMRFGVPDLLDQKNRTTLPCHKCRDSLWVGPKIRAAVAAGNNLWCPSCVIKTFGAEAVSECEVRILPRTDSPGPTSE